MPSLRTLACVTCFSVSQATIAAAGSVTETSGRPQAPSRDVRQDTLVVDLAVDTAQFLSVTSPIAVTVSRPLAADEGTLALVIDGNDVSALAEAQPRGLRYQPSVEPLPPGTPEVVVYLRKGGTWTELRRFRLKVLTAGGFRRIAAQPQATLGNKGQLASGEEGFPPPERPTYQDFSLNGALTTTHEHARFTLETSSAFVGTSRRNEALRFGLRQDRAPLVDLASYQVALRSGGMRLALGHTSFGNSRHLVNGFGSRGATLSWGTPATQVSVAAMGAASMVGWDQLLPVTNGNHRVMAASLRRELLPRRPGALQVDATWIDASMLPRTGFTQGAVVDAEASDGGSLQLSAATPGQRLRLASGLARSRFANPALDRQLSGDSTLVAVEREARMARFVEAGVTPVQGARLGVLGTLTTTLNGRHERVDPLYRSVVAPVQADRQQDGADASISLGALSGQLALTRARDNLAGIASLLTTRTETRSAGAALTVARLLRTTRHAAWLPLLTWTFSHTHQFGADVPVGGVFAPDHVPDQASELRDLGAQWQHGAWRLAMRSNRAEQDNRQPGRVAADFASGSDALSIGWGFGQAGDLALDLGHDFQESRERRERQATRRATLNTNLRRGQSTSIVLALSLLRTRPPAGPVTLNSEQRLEVTQPLSFLRDRSGGTRGQAFVRFGRTTARLPDFARQALDPLALLRQRQWTISSGLNLRVL